MARGQQQIGRAQAHAGREAGLRPLASLPVKAKVFLAVLSLAMIGFGVWITIRLLRTDSLGVAILLMALSYVGIGVVSVALLTVTRAVFSLRALPYVIGRTIYRLLRG